MLAHSALTSMRVGNSCVTISLFFDANIPAQFKRLKSAYKGTHFRDDIHEFQIEILRHVFLVIQT